MLLKLLFFSILVSQITTSCIPWKYSYLEYTSSTNFLSFTATKFNKESWFGIGFSSSPTVNQETILFLGDKNNVYQMTNHTIVSNGTILNEKSVSNSLTNYLDNLLIFQFSINASFILNSSYVLLAHGDGTKTNFTQFSKHLEVFTWRNDFKVGNDIICNIYDISSFRILAANIYAYLLRIVVSILIFILLIYFRNDQPLRSRMSGPFIIIILQMIEISLKYIQESLHAENSVAIRSYCLFSYIYFFPSLQL
jgi:hypothetical protein